MCNVCTPTFLWVADRSGSDKGTLAVATGGDSVILSSARSTAVIAGRVIAAFFSVDSKSDCILFPSPTSFTVGKYAPSGSVQVSFLQGLLVSHGL